METILGRIGIPYILISAIKYNDFRAKYVEFGGDGIYAAWTLAYEETLMAEGHYKKHCPMVFEKLKYHHGLCPVAEHLQPKLMQFVTNYGSLEEAKPKADALRKTIEYFA